METISQRYIDARSRHRQWQPGTFIVESSLNRWTSGLNRTPQAVQITTVTVTDPGDNLDVSIVIEGETITINTGTGLNTAQVGALLAAAINLNGIARGVCKATFDTATLTLTGIYPGQDFQVSEDDAALSAVTNTQSAAKAASIPFARALVQTGWNEDEAEALVALADANRFVAQVVHLTPTFVNSAEIEVSIYEICGAERHFIASARAVSATAVAETVDALVTAVNAAMPPDTVLASDGTTHLVLTSEVPGREFAVEARHVGGGASSPALTIDEETGPDATTSLHRAWAGVSMYSDSDEAPTVGGGPGEYGPNAGVKYAQQGPLAVHSSETPTRGEPVYVELAAGATAGRFYRTPSATRVRMARSMMRWERAGRVAADGMAAIRLLTF